MSIVVYDLTVSKIWCTMCSNKIKSAFEGRVGNHKLKFRCTICVGQCYGRTSYNFYRLRYYVLFLNDIISTFE